MRLHDLLTGSPKAALARPWPHPDGAPHGAQVVVIGLHCQHVGRVLLPVQGPGPPHQEPAVHIDLEVVAIVTCVERQMR